ncbi:MAG TPA: hypothetical protein VN634_08310 [Candidatus Limnocylindrales bacterium]|nr:hypothetical protein [Candidatus Limnocylindrales bacterium]
MDTTRKVILVASASSPDRAIALERLLGAAAARSGWGERLEIRVGGIESGAGRLSDAGTAALKALGIDAEGSICPDLDRRPQLLENAAIVVCDRGDVADVLVDWDEAGEATFVCVSELADSDDGSDDEDALPIGDEVRGYESRIDEVLRRTVADSAA